MKKKVIISLLSVAIAFPTVSSASSNLSNINEYKVVTEAEEKRIEENKNIDVEYVDEGVIFLPTAEQQKLALLKKGEKSNIGIMGQEYPDGTTKVLTVAPYANGSIIEQSKKSGILNTIWNSSMYVAGVFLDTVGGIVLDLSLAFMDSVDKSEGSTTYTYKSYRYIGKDVQVYDSGRWVTWYQAKSRQNYAHTLSTYVTTAGYTRTRSLDMTADRGYSPVKTEYSKNYNNYEELKNRGWTNWYMNKEYYYSPEYGY